MVLCTVSGEETCANCETPLQGDFCHACGQRRVDLDTGIWHLIKEAFGEAFEADGRLASTLVPFFFRPGLLVREFMVGRRARYTSPIRIYVFAVLVCFLSLGFATTRSTPMLDVHEEGVNLRLAQTGPSESRESEPRESAPRKSEPLILLDIQFEAFEKGLAKLNEMEPAEASHVLADETYEAAPKVLLVLVPALAVLLKLAWFRRPFIEHLLFSLNLHSVGMIILALSVLPGSTALALAVTVVMITIHGILGARRVYEYPWLRTVAGCTIVGLIYGALFVFGVALASLLAIATL